MDATLRDPTRQALGSKSAMLLLWAPLVAITLTHYAVGPHLPWAHDVLRRLYYIPIVLGAFYFGRRGALAVSLVTSALYMPHAFSPHGHTDPGTSIEKLLELVLYNVIAVITGTLADREHRERLTQERIAKQLSESVEERRLVEVELVRAGKLRALGELTAGFAHELRNPLASIKGAVEILSDEIAPDSPRRRMVEIVHTEINRLMTLLERFLSFARPQPSRLDDLRIEELAEPVIALLAHQAARSNVELRFRCARPGVRLQADREQLSAVLVNLLLNAVQAMPEGGVAELTGDYATRGRKDYCVLSISDNGPGVPDDLKETIFDPFVTTKPSGTGLGLSVATRVVEAHGGLIQVGNRDGGGAEFRIWLPRVASATT